MRSTSHRHWVPEGSDSSSPRMTWRRPNVLIVREHYSVDPSMSRGQRSVRRQTRLETWSWQAISTKVATSYRLSMEQERVGEATVETRCAERGRPL